MRWWISTDKPYVMSVDNAAAKGMDFSALPPNLWMVQWIDGKGEIEYQTSDGRNLNGLRDPFTDVMPYAPYFQQFLILMQSQGLLLPQAKRVQCDLIETIYDSKRQMPISYLGDSWNCSDKEVDGMTQKAASVMAALFAGQTLEGNDALSSMTTQINDAIDVLETQINTAFGGNTTQINAAFVNDRDNVNVAISQITSQTTTAVNTVASQGSTAVDNLRLAINDVVVQQTRFSVSDLKSQVGSAMAFPIDVSGVNDGPEFIVQQAGLPGANAPGTGITQAAVSGVSIPGVADIPGSGMVPPTTIIPWIPLNSTVARNLTFAQFSELLDLIADRRFALNQTAITKKITVNAMTTISAVIAYDVTTGW